MWTTRSGSSLKESILSRLRQVGATRMEASYSGGNDEGGLDEIRVFRPAGKNDYVLHRVRERGLWENGQQVGTERVRDSFPSAGPYPTKKAALAAIRGLKANLPDHLRAGYQPVVGFEPVKVEDELVQLFDADVGDWDDRDSLYGLVDDLLSIDFGSWAGDFSAHGIVLADLPTRRVWREGEVSTYTSDASAGEY